MPQTRSSYLQLGRELPLAFCLSERINGALFVDTVRLAAKKSNAVQLLNHEVPTFYDEPVERGILQAWIPPKHAGWRQQSRGKLIICFAKQVDSSIIIIFCSQQTQGSHRGHIYYYFYISLSRFTSER